jgi:hypothetical protein
MSTLKLGTLNARSKEMLRESSSSSRKIKTQDPFIEEGLPTLTKHPYVRKVLKCGQ